MSVASCFESREEGEEPHYKIVDTMKKDGDRQEPLVPVIVGMLEETVFHNDQNRTTNSRTYCECFFTHKQNYLINLRTSDHYTII